MTHSRAQMAAQAGTLRQLQELLERFARGNPGIIARSVMRLLAVPPAQAAASPPAGKQRYLSPSPERWNELG